MNKNWKRAAYIVMTMLVLSGCSKSTTKQDETPRGGSGLTISGGGGAVQSVRGAVQRTVDLNTLRSIALFYNTFNSDRGQSPTTQKEFLDYIRRDDRKSVTAIEDGSIILVLGAKVDSNSIVAYAADLTPGGNRLVAIGNTARSMPAQEFETAAKAQGIQIDMK